MKPLVVHGRYRGIELTIYGEIHDRIDPAFYEALELGEDAVWVEHSTQLCDLLPEHEAHFMKMAKQSEVGFRSIFKEYKVHTLFFHTAVLKMLKIESRLRHVAI